MTSTPVHQTEQSGGAEVNAVYAVVGSPGEASTVREATAFYRKTLGRFNLAGSEKDWQVVLQTSEGTVSAMWPEDDEPEVDDMLPTEVAELIEARLKRYMFMSDREQRLTVIAAIRERGTELDKVYVKRRVDSAQKEMNRWADLLEALEAA